VTKISIVLTTAALLACAPAPASAQQQPVPVDQGNGNWDPPPVTSPTTQRRNQPSDRTSSPPEFQNSTPNKPAIAAGPEAATDTPGVPAPQTSGQAPNVSKKMGAEMDSAGDQKASPDGE